jgi:hypothetical protein
MLQANNEQDKTRMYRILEDHITRKKVKVSSALGRIEEELPMLQDRIVPAKSLEFSKNFVEKPGMSTMVATLMMSIGGRTDMNLTLSPNALRQFAASADVPSAYLNDIAFSGEDWKIALASRTLNDFAQHMPTRHLIREVNGEARAFMSDKYKRMDSFEIYKTFIESSQAEGARVVDASYNGFTGYIEVLLTEIFEIPTEGNGTVYAAFGARIQNSDFGTSKLDVKVFMIQVQCFNGMTGQSVMSAVHLGARMGDDVELSDRTHRLDTATKVSAVRDIMKGYFGKERILDNVARIQKSAAAKIELPQVIETLPKMGVTKGEVSLIEKALMESPEGSGITGGSTLWKLSNAVSWIGNTLENPDRQRELSEIAYQIMTK